MTGEEMERAIEFLLEHHAKFSSDIDKLTADIHALKESQSTTTANIQSLTETVVELVESVSRLEAQVEETSGTVQNVIEEMRDGFNKLILANEVTRDLAEKAAQLAINTSHRVTIIENKLQ